MPPFAIIQKQIGETPLQALERFRSTRPELANVAMTYAGRLDPMAEGKLIILLGEECKKREKYTGLDKEYEFEILFGVSSDTGDILGLAKAGSDKGLEANALRKVTKECVGTHQLPYPAFSSKTVEGKPLFEHALSGSLDESILPERDMKIYSIKLLDWRIEKREKVSEDILGKIALLKAVVDPGRPGSDFRKETILSRWKEKGVLGQEQYRIARLKAVVGSGTYIRSLAPFLAGKLGAQALAYSIRRTKIGRYQGLLGSLGIWTSSF